MKIKFKKLNGRYNSLNESGDIQNGDIVIDGEYIVFVCSNCGDYFYIKIEKLKECLKRI